MTYLNQNEQLDLIEKLAAKLFNSYINGNKTSIAEFLENHHHLHHFKGSFSFFLNRQYAQYKLEEDIGDTAKIGFPGGLKPDYFIQLCYWSNDFRKRYKNFNQDICGLNLDLINKEQTKILKVLSNSLSPETLIKFEESFDFSPYNEKLALFQKIILRLAKKQLGYDEDLVERSNIYFNNEDPLNPQKFKNNLMQKKIAFDLVDKPPSKIHKI